MTELLHRSAAFQPQSFDPETRTVSVIFSSGAPVRRFDFDGPYEERLDLAPEAVDLSELIGGPVLNSHDRFDVNSILGVVETAQVDGQRGTATIRFSERAASIMADVRDGIIKSVSVGYVINQKRVDKDPTTGTRIITATRWTPKEISFVTIPADPAAKVRGDNMDKPTERTHANEVRSIGELAGMSAEQTASMVERNLTPDEARREAFEHLKKRNGPPIRTAHPAHVRAIGYDDPVFLRNAMADALYVRVNHSHQAGEAARPYINRRVADLAREILLVRGFETIGWSDTTVIDRALHSTSDFPLLLGDVANKVLREMLQAAPAAIKAICRQATIPDFRNRYSLQLGQAPTLEKVNELGEFKSGTITEGRESYKLDTYGKIFGISRQALVNDNLGAFSDIGRLFAASAAQFEAQFIVDLLTVNSGLGPVMSDTKKLFDNAHGNLAGSGAAISDTTLSAARLALRSQKGLDGKTPLDIAARFLVVPAAQETAAEKYLASLYPAQASNVNPFAGKLTLIVDPRLDAKSTTRWYVAADPAQVPSIEYAYLSGAEGVQVETRAGFEVDGVQIRARLDFGAGVLDFRGIYANPGA
ncbi:MAG TPA: prohead protease/major capsid protein fusion protein [Methylomirabilota bacterium]|nr:prohead protease/major capsid protein fusion protein [Methylomirabilota bacterium]